MAKEMSIKYARQDLRSLLEERNKQNAFLREQLVARIEHSTHLETRLLCTLDTLDELQASSARELQQAHYEMARLTEKLRVLEAIARDADTEKYDMSNAVLQLVAKVESCNGYSKWRVARTEFSHDIALQPLRTAGTSQATASRKEHEGCTCEKAYAPAIVEELSDSLAREKRAHALTAEDAERRIAALQSRIAVRDAEISRRSAMCRCLPPSSSLDTPTRLDLMSEEEQARVTARTAERNRILGLEVTALEDKVRRERQSRESDSRPLVDHHVQTEPQVSSHACSSAKSQARAASPDTDSGDDPVLGALYTLDAQISQLRKRLTDLVVEKESLQYVLRDEMVVQESNTLLSPRLLEHEQPTERPVTPDAGNSDVMLQEGQKDRDDFTNILLLEEECIRLMRSESNLRSCSEQMKQSIALLKEENARLKGEISKLRGTDDRPEQPSPLSLDRSVINLSFPPLQPDVVSPTYSNYDKGEDAPVAGPSGWKKSTSSGSSTSSSSSPLTPTSTIEPSEVPLPRTPTSDDPETELSIQDEEDDNDDEVPVGSREPRLSANPPYPREHREQFSPPPDEIDRSLDQRDAQTIERELVDARAGAEAREREIAEVRDVMADLALRISNELQGQGS